MLGVRACVCRSGGNKALALSELHIVKGHRRKPTTKHAHARSHKQVPDVATQDTDNVQDVCL